MSNIPDQLFQAAESAAAMAGGGGDDNNPPNADGYRLVQRGGYYVALDNGGKEIARSQDQNTTMQRAKSYLRNPSSPVQAQPSEAIAPLAEVSENPVISQQGYPTNPYQLNQQLQPVQPRQPGQFDATPMQTRMPQASAIDPAQAVLQGAAQTAGSAAVTPQGTATQTTGVAPGQETPEQQRSRTSWTAPGKAVQFTQEDFYPNPQDPAQYGYSTGLEVVARPGRMPMGALSKAAAALNDRQLELDEKRQAFNDELYKPIKTASPYQQNFNVIVNKQRDEFVKSVADAYTGGDINKAYREIFASPQLRNRWRQINADLEALGQRGADIFAKAEKYLADAATNAIGSTPEMRKLARDIMYGMGGYATADQTGGSFDALIKNINQFEMMEGRDRYFRDTVTKSVANFFEQDPEIIRTDTGRYIFLTERSKKHWTSHINQLSRDMAIYQGYGSGPGLDQKIKDNEEYLTNMLGQQIEDRTEVIDKYKGMGGGSGDGAIPTAKNVYGYKITARNPSEEKEGGSLYWVDVARTAGANVGSVSGLTSQGEVAGIDEIPLMGTTAGEARPMRTKYLGDKHMIPLAVFRDADGKMWLRGKSAGEAGVKKVTDAKGNTTTQQISLEELTNSIQRDPQTGESIYTNFELLKDVVVPFYNTSGDIEAALGMNASQASQYIDQQRAAKGYGQRTAAGARTSSLAAAQPNQDAMAREWEAMKKANPNMSADAITAAVKKKFGVK